MLARAGRESDYAEIRLGGDICYNPLHNDLDPYAVAYAIATLVNNLFGKSKEPFWQQAYTDLLKFVILLRRLVDGYTTFAEVYRYILDDTQIESEITKLKATLTQPPEVIVVPLTNYELQVVGELGWKDWFLDGPDHMAHPYNADLESLPAPARQCPVRGAARAGHGVDGTQAPARRREPLVHARLDAPRPSPSLLHHRRHRRLPVAVRRQPRGPSHVLPAAKRLSRTAETRRTHGRCRRSRTCWRPATCWR